MLPNALRARVAPIWRSKKCSVITMTYMEKDSPVGYPTGVTCMKGASAGRGRLAVIAGIVAA
jgi:hypothetical protein